jgi:hypothetical protein
MFSEPDVGLRVPVAEPDRVAEMPQGKDKTPSIVAKCC